MTGEAKRNNGPMRAEDGSDSVRFFFCIREGFRAMLRLPSVEKAPCSALDSFPIIRYNENRKEKPKKEEKISRFRHVFPPVAVI